MIDRDIDYDQAFRLLRRKDRYCYLRSRQTHNQSTGYDIVVNEFDDISLGTLKEEPSEIIPVSVFAATALKEICEQIGDGVWILLPKTELVFKNQVLLQA